MNLTTLLIVLLLVVLFGGGGYSLRTYAVDPHTGGLVGLLVLILVVVLVVGIFRPRGGPPVV